MTPKSNLEKRKGQTGPANLGKSNLLILGIIVIIIIVLAALFLAPKTPEVVPPETTVDLPSILTDIVAAADQVNTFKYDLTAELRATGNATQTVTISGSGEVDINNRAMHTNLHITTPDGLQSSEVYMLRDTTYVKISGKWVKQTKNNAWDFQNSNTERLSELLSTGEGTLVKTETINGVKAEVIRIRPEIEPLVRYVMNLQGAALTQEQSDSIVTLFRQYVKSAEMKLWVSPQNFVMRAELDSSIDMSDYELVKANITIHATLNLEDYNKEAIIELPAEAENATDLSTITA